MTRGRGKKAAQNMGSSSMMVYKGPVALLSDITEPVVKRFLLKNALSFNSSLTLGGWAGNIGTYTGTGQGTGLSNCPDWASFAAIYEEFRVLGIEVHYEPKNQFASTAAFGAGQSPIAVAGVHTNAGVVTPSAYTDVITYENSELHNTARPFTYSWKMSGAEEAGFESTSSASNHGSIIMFADGLPTTVTQVGLYYVKWLVEFRQTR